MRPDTRKRAGFTLVELLVAMAVLVTLASLALLVVPGVLDQDRTTDGASMVRQYLMIAKARAARDGLPRGVRLISSLDATTPAKTNNLWVTEIQYIESPPILVGNRTPNANLNVNPNQPTIQFSYDMAGTAFVTPPPGPPSPGPPFAGLHCYVLNCPAVTSEVTNTSFASGQYLQMFLPDLRDPLNDAGFWCKIVNYKMNAGVMELVLNRYPDLGAANQYVTYDFGVLAPARPLAGEPTQQLPRDICIDLVSSSPAGSAGSDYDILFAPNGQVLNTTGQINLWVRNYTKPGGNPNVYAAPNGNYSSGGEQQIVALKAKSGSLGVFPVAWTATPFQFAQQGATGYGN